MVIDERKPIATPVTQAVISCPYVVECDYISGNNALTAKWYRNDFGLMGPAGAWRRPDLPRGPRRHEAEAVVSLGQAWFQPGWPTWRG